MSFFFQCGRKKIGFFQATHVFFFQILQHCSSLERRTTLEFFVVFLPIKSEASSN